MIMSYGVDKYFVHEFCFGIRRIRRTLLQLFGLNGAKYIENKL